MPSVNGMAPGALRQLVASMSSASVDCFARAGVDADTIAAAAARLTAVAQQLQCGGGRAPAPAPATTYHIHGYSSCSYFRRAVAAAREAGEGALGVAMVAHESASRAEFKHWLACHEGGYGETT